MVMVSSLGIYKPTCLYLILILSLECNEIYESNALTKRTQHLDSGLVGSNLIICKSTCAYGSSGPYMVLNEPELARS